MSHAVTGAMRQGVAPQEQSIYSTRGARSRLELIMIRDKRK
jgi:hypothetical protein